MFPSLSEKLAAIVERQKAATEYFNNSTPVEGQNNGLNLGILRQLDSISRISPVNIHPDSEELNLENITKSLRPSIVKLGYLSVNHAVFEVSRANLFETRLTESEFNPDAKLNARQLGLLASNVYLNRQEVLVHHGIYKKEADDLAESIAIELGVSNIVQAIRAVAETGLLKNFDPVKHRQTFIKTNELEFSSQALAIVSKKPSKKEAQNLETTDSEIKPTNEPNPFDSLPERSIKIINMVARGMTGRAIANRLGLEDVYYKTIIADILAKTNGENLNNLIFLAHRAGVLNYSSIDTDRVKTGVSFTDMQRNVIGLMCIGQNRSKISLTLGISESSVQDHIRAVYDKLKVNSSQQAIAAALKLKLIK